MSRLLYQGVAGINTSCHPERSEGPAFQEFSCSETDPKLREECGVVAIHGHPEAAREAYLGLYALQHRGQESAGIATADGLHLANIKGMGLVSEIFTEDVLQKLPGRMAIGHTRYSTTGDSALLNAQPIRVDSTKGLIAIAHNGNLVNLGTVRTRLERAGAYFQTTSDSEIIVQLIAHSRAGTLVDAIADSLSQVEGAFSIVMMTRDRIFAARDPRGFRPLSMGRIHNPDGPDTVVFASESCAFDLLRAEFVRDVLPGELVMVTEDGVTSRQYASGVAQSSCIFEHVYFARPDSRSTAGGCRRAATRWAANSPANPASLPMSWCRCPTPVSRPRSGTPKRRAFPSGLVSSATTTLAAPLLNPNSAYATSASASSSTPCAISSRASASY